VSQPLKKNLGFTQPQTTTKFVDVVKEAKRVLGLFFSSPKETAKVRILHKRKKEELKEKELKAEETRSKKSRVLEYHKE